jgi:hypothetical protein
MALAGLWHIKEELARPFFLINPTTKTLRAKIMSPSHISLVNYLDECPYENIFHKPQDYKQGIKLMRVRATCGSRIGGWSLPGVMSD